MSMDWIDKLKGLIPFKASASSERKTLRLIMRIEPGELEECKVGIVRNERPLWLSDKILTVHKEPGEEITFKRLE